MQPAKVVCVSFLLMVSMTLWSQPVSPEIRQQIRTAQDLRDSRALLNFLTHAEHSVRRDAAVAAASVQDTGHIPVLISLLADNSTKVRAAAGLALGQMNYVVDSLQRRRVSRVLTDKLRDELDNAVILSLTEAMGKVGDREGLDSLVMFATAWQPWRQKAEAALSVGRFAYRGTVSEQATAFAASVLDLPPEAEPWKAAYALMRVGNDRLLRPHLGRLLAAARQNDPHVRMFAVTALGGILDSTAGLALLTHFAQADPDWRVRVNAVKSLALYGPETAGRAITGILRTVHDPDEHVSLTAMSSIGRIKDVRQPFRNEIELVLVGLLEDGGRYSERQKKEAAVTLARMNGANAYPLLERLMESGLIVRRAFIEALGFVPRSESVFELLQYSRMDDMQIKRASLGSIISVCQLGGAAAWWLDSARTALRQALDVEDMAVITTAAEALAESLFADDRSGPALLRALRRLRTPEDVEPMVAIIQSLGKLKSRDAVVPLLAAMNDEDRVVALEAAKALEEITGKPHRQFVAPHSSPRHTAFEWQLLSWLSAHPMAEVHTSKGSIRIRLFPDDAPFTCVNFVKLAGQGFYDGLIFHRVVPNFVIQGGDPRGDGWGGPGYSIRSEFSSLTYDEGMVGMASAGKDTEGSQFFITHSRQPHLDGRYTIFGKVVAGKDVVDRIQMGDRIESISLVTESEEEDGR